MAPFVIERAELYLPQELPDLLLFTSQHYSNNPGCFAGGGEGIDFKSIPPMNL